MPVPKQGEYLISVGLSLAVGASGGWVAKKEEWGAMLAVATGLAIAFVGVLYARKADEAERRARRKDFLDEYIKCPGGCKAQFPRRHYWRIPRIWKYAGTPVCAECFTRIMGRAPNEPEDGDRHAF